MTRKELLTEVMSDFEQYEEAGLIDDISLKRYVKNELLRFGGNLMDLKETTLRIKNNKVTLEDDFWKVYLAVKCQPNGYIIEGDEKVIQNSLFYKERIERDAEWDNTSNSFRFSNHKQIIENHYINGNTLKLGYNNPQLLRVSKHMVKSSCHPSSINLNKRITSRLPYEISINKNTLYTNFKEGFIYMKYYGLHTNEEGELLIPETQHRRIEEYIMNFCKKKILEKVVANGDGNSNDVQLLKYFTEETKHSFSLAMTESKFEGLGEGWASAIRNNNRRETMKYDLMLPYK